MTGGYDFIPFIYNNLSERSPFNIDLRELFGAEDGTETGLVGRWNPAKRDFKSTTWDWNPSGFKLVVRLLYYLLKRKSGSPFSFDEFERFYKERVMHNKDLLKTLQQEGVFPDPCYMVYIIKYRGVQFPALLLEIENLSWSKKIWVTFKPIKYFVTDDGYWKRIKREVFEWGGDYNRENWIEWLGLESDQRDDVQFVEDLLKDPKQRTFGLMPLEIIDYYERYRLPRIFYLRKVEKKKRETYELPSDNQVFWYLFHHITRTPQVIEDLTIPYNDKEYLIKGLLINTLSQRTFVYRQEFGVPNVLCKVLLERFGKQYIDAEFSGQSSISIKDTSVLRRAFRVSEIPGEERSEYADSNYDYAVDLKPLQRENRILFDLTTALWYKGALSPEEYFKKWRGQLFETILNHEDLKLVWYITIDETEKKFYEMAGVPHNNFNETLEEITLGLDLEGILAVVGDSYKIEDERIIVLPIFRNTPGSRNVSNELYLLRDRHRETKFYQVVDQVIK